MKGCKSAQNAARIEHFLMSASEQRVALEALFWGACVAALRPNAFNQR